jgi:hypothetical protein
MATGFPEVALSSLRGGAKIHEADTALYMIVFDIYKGTEL